jgi:hypothetical protein
VRQVLKNSTPKAEARDYKLMRAKTSPGEPVPGPAERAFAAASSERALRPSELAQAQGFEL